MNCLELDDVPLDDEGEPVDPGSVLRLRFDGERPVFPRIEPTADDDIVEDDVILLWNERPRVVTGTDIPGRLLRGIARPSSPRRPG